MAHKILRGLPTVLLAVAVLLLTLRPSVCVASQNQESKTTVPNSSETQKVQAEDRAITYQWVETPKLKPPLVESANSQLTKALDSPNVSEPTTSKPYLGMTLTARVIDHRWSEVRWFHEGVEYVFWSNINFNVFQNVSDFETPDTTYSLFTISWDETETDLKQYASIAERVFFDNLKSNLPEHSGLETKSSYLFTSKTQNVEVKQAVEALHRFYDKKSQELKKAYEEAKLAQKKAEEELKANPPQPKDSIITFFPIRSVYTQKNQQ